MEVAIGIPVSLAGRQLFYHSLIPLTLSGWTIPKVHGSICLKLKVGEAHPPGWETHTFISLKLLIVHKKYEKVARKQHNCKLVSCLTTSLHISQTSLRTLLYDTYVYFNKLFFTHGHSLSDVANSKHFQTLRGNFETADIRNFPRTFFSPLGWREEVQSSSILSSVKCPYQGKVKTRLLAINGVNSQPDGRPTLCRFDRGNSPTPCVKKEILRRRHVFFQCQVSLSQLSWSCITLASYTNLFKRIWMLGNHQGGCMQHWCSW